MQPLYVALFRILEGPEGDTSTCGIGTTPIVGGQTQRRDEEEECDAAFPRAALAHGYATHEHTRRHLAAKGEEVASSEGSNTCAGTSTVASGGASPPLQTMEQMALFFMNKTLEERASSWEIRRRRIDDVGSSVSYHMLLDGKGIGFVLVCDSAYALPPSLALDYSSPRESNATIDVIRFTDYLLSLLDSLAMKAETASLGATASVTASVEPPSQRQFTSGRGPLARMLARTTSANQHQMFPADCLFPSADAGIKPNSFSSQSAAFNTRVAEVLAETSDRPAVPLYSSKCQRQCRRTSGSSWTFFAAK